MAREKITVTLEAELIHEIDRIAKARHESRSRMVESAIRSWKRSRIERELEEGYRTMGEENRRVAEESLPAGHEAWK